MNWILLLNHQPLWNLTSVTKSAHFCFGKRLEFDQKTYKCSFPGFLQSGTVKTVRIVSGSWTYLNQMMLAGMMVTTMTIMMMMMLVMMMMMLVMMMVAVVVIMIRVAWIWGWRWCIGRSFTNKKPPSDHRQVPAAFSRDLRISTRPQASSAGIDSYLFLSLLFSKTNIKINKMRSPR